MKSELPNGAIVKFRQRGQDRLFQIHGDPGTEQGYGGVPEGVKAGTTVFKCVWKGDRLEVRRIYLLKKDLAYERIFQPPPDGLQRSKIPFTEIHMVTCTINGHQVLMMEAGTSILMGGASWSWMKESAHEHAGEVVDGILLPSYEPVSLTPLGTATDEQVRAHAEEAIAAMHSFVSGVGAPPCFACNPPMRPVEK